jgi:hypothetical protein
MQVVTKRKEFTAILDSCDQVLRNQVIEAYITDAWPHIDNPGLDKTNRHEILEAISVYRRRQRLSATRAYKIFLLAEYGVNLVNTYELRGSHCRPRHYLTKKPQTRPRKRVIAKRRPSIRDWRGNTLPRTYLDKLSVKIHNQSDYDRYQERIMGMSRDDFQDRLFRGILR